MLRSTTLPQDSFIHTTEKESLKFRKESLLSVRESITFRKESLLVVNESLEFRKESLLGGK